jgi:succinyl-CoA synthetase beta subunit
LRYHAGEAASSLAAKWEDLPMNLHEYQAKALLKPYGVALPAGRLADTAEAAEQAAREIGGDFWVVKAQIHAGARGKAGGVRLVHTLEEVRAAAVGLLGSRLVTEQTGAAGKEVHRVYVEQGCHIDRELYLAALVDRSQGKVALLASQAGGENIEAAARAPGALLKIVVDPVQGLGAAEAAGLAADLGMEGAAAEAVAELATTLYKAFIDHDASLIEINPLVVTRDGQVRALDVKMILDDNALFRHPDLEALRDEADVDPWEVEAQRHELNYVRLDGNIGCMVNGAGLALATLDMIKDNGGDTADFMDVRPVATRDQVATGIKMLLANPKVKAILINVYGGGILRCDTIAEGLATAAKDVGLTVPVVFRAAGTNAEIACKLLADRSVRVILAHDLGEAARMVVAAAKGEAI